MERLMRIHEDVMRVLTVRVEKHEEGPSAVLQARSQRDDRGDRATVTAATATAAPAARAAKTRTEEDQTMAPRPFFRRRKSCPFSGANAPTIDYKDVKLLQRYISERGKIVPTRGSPPSRRRSSASWPARSSAPASSALLPYAVR